MEHLPPPIDGTTLSVKAYAVLPEYEPEDFFKLPGKDGQDFGSLLAKGYPKDRGNTDKMKEFLQQWLFFALLAQCLNTTIFLEDFKSGNNGITTEKLSHFLKEWVASQQNELAFDAAKRMRKYRARWALAEARRYVEKHCSMRPFDHDAYHPSPHHRRSQGDAAVELEGSGDLAVLYLSFAILGETLQRTGVLSQDQDEPWYDIVFDDKTWGYSTHNFKTLLKNNPCRAEVRRLESTFSGVLATYCASTMERPRYERDPPDVVDHAGCTAAGCLSTENSKDLPPKHFEKFCNQPQGDNQPQCDKAQFEITQLDKIIHNKQVPLLTWEQGKLQVKGYDLEKDNVIFGALSHRWKDNILVSKEDSYTPGVKLAYTCQLKKLQDTFDAIVPKPDGVSHIPFWVDSLCTTKVSADTMLWSISQTRHIYKKATTVLVWDRGLLTTTKDDHDGNIALNMRIRASRWAQRMWTLLETVVSNDFAIAFRNGPVSLKKLEKARDEAQHNDRNRYHYVWRLGQPFSPAIEELRSSLTSPTSPRVLPPRYHMIACLWRAVQFRLVSDPKDETIVLANVLNLDAIRLLKIKDGSAEKVQSERMIEFLDILDSTPGLGVPPGIIFLPGPPLRDATATDKKGYGWAPKSWLSKRPQHEANPLIENVFDSFIGKHGLFVTYPGVLLHCSGDSNTLWEEFHVPLDENLLQWYHVTMVSDDISLSDPGNNSNPDFVNDSKPQLCDIEHNGDKSSNPQLGLILSTTRYDKIGEKGKLGVLVRVQGKLGRGKALWVSKLCRAWVRLETDRDEIGRCVQRMRNKEDGIFVGETLPEEQLWCVDRDDGDILR